MTTKKKEAINKQVALGKVKQKDKLIKKGANGFFRVVFGRTGIMAVALLVQIVILFYIFEKLRPPVAYYLSVNAVIGIVISLIIINHEKYPEFQVTWLIFVWIAPFTGALFYLFTKSQLAHFILDKTIRDNMERTGRFSSQNSAALDHLKALSTGEANLASYAFSHGRYPVYDDTDVTYYPLGEDKFVDLVAELEKAEHFIFMEYFIIKEGHMWNTVLEILKRKAAAGVEVRLMYDGTCTLMLLPHDYPKKMEALGIACKVFSPIKPFLTTTQNNRDHRKIVVIDGRVAFTGGINLSDEYINRVVRFGHWKDTAVMLKGSAVRTMTMLFMQLWNVEGEKDGDEDYERYLGSTAPGLQTEKSEACTPQVHLPKGYVLPYGESPLDKELFGENIYLDIINKARHYVHIMTPYLIIDSPLMTALTFAAKRGVDVCLILPHIPDKVYAFALAKSYYRQLIAAGVKIYEYLPGFVHAKEFVCDGMRAVVSTINLDYRSLYLHFECGVYLYKAPVIGEIEKDMQSTIAKSQLITMEEYKNSSRGLKLLGKILRLIAPLM